MQQQLLRLFGVIDEDLLEYKGISRKEWKDRIGRYHNQSPENIDCFYDGSAFFAMVYGGDGLIASYRFDDETGGALDIISGSVIDFIDGKTVEVSTTYGTNVTFNDSQILAVGYVPDIHLEEFVEKNFISGEDFINININDFRMEENQVEGYGNRFVFVPKTSDVKVEIYDCFINENDEFELDNTLVANQVGSFIFLDDYMTESTIPTSFIKLRYHGFEDIIPIVFSGEDGKLDFTGHETEIKDISIYDD